MIGLLVMDPTVTGTQIAMSGDMPGAKRRRSLIAGCFFGHDPSIPW